MEESIKVMLKLRETLFGAVYCSKVLLEGWFAWHAPDCWELRRDVIFYYNARASCLSTSCRWWFVASFLGQEGKGKILSVVQSWLIFWFGKHFSRYLGTTHGSVLGGGLVRNSASRDQVDGCLILPGWTVGYPAQPRLIHKRELNTVN